jgi:hypothetical protein
MTKNPSKFLDAYTKEDQAVFFGREQETDELFTKVLKSNLLLMYGASGTGKTSIINCGLANKIADSDWLPIFIRRKTNLMQSIRREFQNLLPDRDLSELPLVRQVKAIFLKSYRPLYLIFDQFEELFILGEDDEKEIFLAFVRELSETDYNFKLIFVIREEYLANLSEFEEVIPTLFDNRIRIEKMTDRKVRNVIEQTCESYHIRLENVDVAEQMIGNIKGKQPRVELTYLQVYLDRLYKNASQGSSQVVFSKKEVDKTSSIDDVLSTFLDEQINDTNFKDPALAWAILKAFVSQEGTKKQVDYQSIMQYLKETLNLNIPSDVLREYVKKLGDLKIIREIEEN